jgi:hypothetical protein
MFKSLSGKSWGLAVQAAVMANKLHVHSPTAQADHASQPADKNKNKKFRSGT